jgi:hypothetical protein
MQGLGYKWKAKKILRNNEVISKENQSFLDQPYTKKAATFIRKLK